MFYRNSTRPLVKKEITKQVLEIHEKHGGRPPNSDPDRILNKALPLLCSTSEIERVGSGYYRALAGVADRAIETEPSNDDIELAASGMHLEPEQTLGEGPESVYVYFSENDRELSGYKQKSTWPCKVGFARGSVSSRVLAQGIKTAMASFPKIGLVIKSDNASALERVLHSALTEADAWIEEAPGSEWFMTSPQRITKWYEVYRASIKALEEN